VQTQLLVSAYYLVAAAAVTIWLWQDPASRIVAGNPGDAEVLGWRLPSGH
jgi:hypothetical protein